MPTYKETPRDHVPDPIPVIHGEQYTSNIVDSEYEPFSGFITSIKGFPWTSNYYSGVRGKSDETMGSQPNQPSDATQYRLIVNLELKVIEPLRDAFDQTTGRMSTTGSAHVYPVLIPAKGEVFTADIGDGRAGVFEITSVERLSRFRRAVHRIEYRLKEYVTNEVQATLNTRVVKRVYFRREYMEYNRNPIVESENIAYVRRLEESFDRLMKEYIHRFFSNEYRVLLVPDQASSTYDHWLSSAIRGFYRANEQPNYAQLHVLNDGGEEGLKAKTLFDALRDRDYHLLNTIVQRVGTVLTTQFSAQPLNHSLYHSGIRRVVYPTDGSGMADTNHGVAHVFPKAGDLAGSKPYTSRGFITEEPLPEKTWADDVSLIHRTDVDDYYILSEAFYMQAPTGQSLLELQVSTFLKRKDVDQVALVHLIHDMHTWGAMERFYYTPLILVLIHAAIRGI